ncbi:TAXI family TRAP transporter solute-binding subunit [Pseudorhodoferax sp. Leaf267]|uniref:TAXI family TRAP transporter solute-binding subunit n=1 Tax=Pseudorhodoferax sp. Leaf267 TaxID=1736316 RepID=UPI0006F49E68|nr:TAXI family TRAP transporter solute-binding subunit [Pseudorhodoferax sp. Leaf267]KQP14724.1 C4-dicarboxylate ABC transporter substrate-binding protein [Pseudorhodoferax sp. Leaf267]
MPRLIKLLLLGLRDLLASAGPVVLLAIGVLAAAYWYLEPQPPRSVTLATGPAGSAYAEFGRRYAEALRANGITVVLKATDGSVDNLALLRRGEADVAFVRGGSADPVADEEAGLVSLGALFYEPLWIFYRQDAVRRSAAQRKGAFDALADLRPLRVNVDSAGSGVPDIMARMLRANRLDPAALQLSNLAQSPATEALQAGLLDAVVLASAPESPLVQRLLRTPGIGLLDLRQSDAYTRIFPFFSAVSLPRGIVDLRADVPADDVAMVATTTSLLSRGDTHPALRQLFAQAAQTIHGGAGWFNRARDFPNTRTSELPVSAEGDRAINGTPPFWQRYMPFWASNLIERMWLVLGGLVVLLLPLSRIVPPLYTFRVRSRVFRWYGRLREIEARLDAGDADVAPLLEELNELDRVVNKVAVPLSYADELYALRNNIHATRKRLQAHGAPATTAPAK